ncbi:unnamed protein product (macronuclear) [Paramecium tetraurelia]|uniref:B box-type domain-containing protein n=1 Tax=Paramecium tetraurelia TaxID=5888 RepID=A0BKE3_PARTE|nr:uncharacterized protein GSPATT00029641001 [Paramecium tetraurelia]CAK59010.1 unnamed protein product [Paramecium tetraurelia]|eukprot:XP_001426408.1 hypothetical protein (macronuclear) [Paramecium tetraurelia strain d4-2]
MMNVSKCSKCSKVPDDILMLTCSHDLCLLCAAKSFSMQQPKRSKKFFVCDICSSNTELDANSVYELEKLHLTNAIQDRSNRKPGQQSKSNLSIEKQVKPRSQTRQDNKENAKEKSVKYTNQTMEARVSIHQSQRKMSKQQSENSFISQPRGMCADHPEEEVSYFCFDCNSKCICPECIIHGIHKNHEVKTIKKSYPIVRKQLEDQLEQNNQCIIQVENYRQDLEKKQIQQQAIQDHLKLQIAQEFQILHQLLNNKQSELLEKVDNLPTIMEQQEGYINRLNEVEIKVQNFNEKINDMIDSKDECGLLNYYGSIYGQTTPQLPPLPNIKEVQLSNQIFSQINDAKKLLGGMDIDCNQ